MRGHAKCEAEQISKACVREVIIACFKEDFLEMVMHGLGAS